MTIRKYFSCRVDFRLAYPCSEDMNGEHIPDEAVYHRVVTNVALPISKRVGDLVYHTSADFCTVTPHDEIKRILESSGPEVTEEALQEALAEVTRISSPGAPFRTGGIYSLSGELRRWTREDIELAVGELRGNIVGRDFLARHFSYGLSTPQSRGEL